MRRVIDTTAPRMIVLAGAAAIIVACCTAYIPAVCGGFIWDDDKYVTANPLLTAPDGLYRIWFSMDAPSQYFPLAYTSYWIEHKLWGFNPMGYHVVNVEIHTINALLLWLVLRRLSIPGAWFASAVFALHPVNVESVAWITERKNTLMLFFSLLTVLCWMEFALFRRSGRRAYTGSLLLYALALLGKSTACTLPAALVLILWLKRIPLTAKRWLQVAPFVAMGLGMGLLVMWWQIYHQGMGIVNLGLGPEGKILIAGRALWFYMWKLFWPTNLTFSYPRWQIDPSAIWQYIYPAASILALVGVWLWRERLGRAATAAILYFPAMLFPMLGFFYIFTFIYSFVADHYQYAACIGPITLVAAGGAHVLRRLGTNGRFFILLAGGILLLTLGVLTWRQCRIYTNEMTLWEDTLNKNPDSWLANSRIGMIYLKQQKFDDAEIYMERKIKLASYMKAISPYVYAIMHYKLGFVFEAQGKLDNAVNYYQKSLDIYDNLILAHYRLAVVLAKQGNFEMAVPHLRNAVETAKAEKNDRFAGEISRLLGLLEEKAKNPNDRKPIPWSVLDSSYQEQYNW
jgi:tetratricopeptide (TPR) repeat protein